MGLTEKCAIRCALQPNDAAANALSEADFVALINEHAGQFTFKVVATPQEAEDAPTFVVRVWTDAERTAEVLVGRSAE